MVERSISLVPIYTQFAARPDPHAFSHIMVLNPVTGQMVAFKVKSLPFGSVRSVHAFLRVAHSLWFLLVQELGVLTTNYFDDYITLATVSESP